MTATNRLVPAAEQLSLLPADEVPVVGPWCQRWQPGRQQHSWRHTSEGGFDPARYHVRPVEETTARRFVVEETTARRFVVAHHYSGAYPAARLRYGMFHGQTLVGVAVLSVPMNIAVLTAVWPGLVPFHESLELGRFLLRDDVEAPAESWFLARVLRQAATLGVRGVVTFADPVARRTLDGTLICPGHCGISYQASNARYLGRSRARTLKLLPDGRVLSDRTIAKLLSGDRGREYAERLLVGFGAKPRHGRESAEAWLPRALADARVRRLQHHGNHRFALIAATNRAEARALRAMLPAGGTYPKHLDGISTTAFPEGTPAWICGSGTAPLQPDDLDGGR